MLQKYGIPPVMMKMIQSLREGMKAEVSVDGSVTSESEVQNGLGQGCTYSL